MPTNYFFLCVVLSKMSLGSTAGLPGSADFLGLLLVSSLLPGIIILETIPSPLGIISLYLHLSIMCISTPCYMQCLFTDLIQSNMGQGECGSERNSPFSAMVSSIHRLPCNLPCSLILARTFATRCPDPGEGRRQRNLSQRALLHN